MQEEKNFFLQALVRLLHHLQNMRISFNRNIQFTRLIKIGGRLREFNFRKGAPGLEGLFTVDVLDAESPQGNRIIFKMKNSGNEWQIIDAALPAWIMQTETTLHQVITEELNNFSPTSSHK